jgi:hypothetical protein
MATSLPASNVTPIDAPPRVTVIRCLRPDGDTFYRRHAPAPPQPDPSLARPSLLNPFPFRSHALFQL